jgi:Abnormal spindle-like microcephaly-assoc'd, ASPM-SPD-2-Hydin
MSRLPLRAHARRAARLGLPVLTLAPAALLALGAGPAHAAAHVARFQGIGCGGAVSGVPANPDNVYTVPDGVTSVELVVQGQRGGGSNGGLPAKLTVPRFAVTPDDTIYVCVGVGGGTSLGNAGGGLSLIAYSATGNSPYFVAGGGGGAGGDGSGTGGAGGNAGVNWGNGTTGRAAGAAYGGAGGNGSAGGVGGTNTAGPSFAGGAGNGRFGGSGGAPGGPSSAGGGGGAGFYGGGGGAAGDDSVGAPGAGGGGGFSYCVYVCTSTAANTTDGPYVEFSYKDPSTTTLTAPTTKQGELYTYTATVSPVPGGGTVAFTRDGAPIEGCESVPVEGDGRAVCRKQARVAGGVEVEAAFSGTEDYDSSSDIVDHTTLSSSMTATPSPIAFGEIAVGGWDTRTLTVTNTGEADLEIEGMSGIRLGNYRPSVSDNDTDFSVSADDCSGRTLTTGQTCQVTVRFAPHARGVQRAQIDFGTNAYAGTYPVRVDGTGIVASLTVTPSPVDFGQVALGTTASREITVTNGGDAAVEIGAIAGVRIGGYVVASPAPNTTDFSLAADGCTGRTLAPGASCTVTIAFTPTAIGERNGRLTVDSSDAVMHAPVRLTGVGVVAPDPRADPRPEPRTDPEPRTEPTKPAGRGAVLAPSARRGVSVAQNGGVRLPLQCPSAQPCSASGELTLTVAGPSTAGARAAAAKTKVLVRFTGVKIAAGKGRTLSLRLPAAFVKAQQKKHVRKLVTTLTIRTTLGSGRTITTRQQVTLLIPRAAAKPKPTQRPSFTG